MTVMTDVPASILHAFLASCERDPTHPCILFEGRTLTYSDVHDLVRRWASSKYWSHLHERCNCWNQNNVDLGVAHNPEEIFIEPTASATRCVIERSAEGAIHS